MEYLTAVEVSKIWGISNRQVTLYCKQGRINGSFMKGKTWLIPSNAKKPMDKRRTKKIFTVEDDPYLQGELSAVDKYEYDKISNHYHTNEVHNQIGISRETLRYYEKIGLITPKRDKDSQYREFSHHDITCLMTIEFYKNKGFTPSEIKELSMKSSKEEILKSFNEKEAFLKEEIAEKQRMLYGLSKTRKFYEKTKTNTREFEIKNFPIYEVVAVMDDQACWEQYGEISNDISRQSCEMIGGMFRVMTFDDDRYNGSKVCFIKQSEDARKNKDAQYLISGKCLYTVTEGISSMGAKENPDETSSESLFILGLNWIKTHNLTHEGVVYVSMPFVMFKGDKLQVYNEIWIPIK